MSVRTPSPGPDGAFGAGRTWEILTIGPGYSPTADCITHVEGRVGLEGLEDAGRQFDAVSLNAGLSNEDALVISLVAWRLLKIGGAFTWHGSYADDEGPKLDVVSMFYRAFEQCLKEIRRDDVVMALKIADRPGEVMWQ